MNPDPKSFEELSNALAVIDHFILRHADKDIFQAYTNGKNNLKKTAISDADCFSNLGKIIIDYYTDYIKTLPESEQQFEALRVRFIAAQYEAIHKAFTLSQKNLDKNLFIFYIIGYVNDLIGKYCKPTK